MVTLKEGKILEQWSALLENCHGEEEKLLENIDANLKAYQARCQPSP